MRRYTYEHIAYIHTYIAYSYLFKHMYMVIILQIVKFTDSLPYDINNKAIFHLEVIILLWVSK
jgi:hypothetical protein